MITTTTIMLTREELYQRIWDRPTRDVAREVGLSDVGLRKFCHRNGIPTPPQGFHLMNAGPAKERLRRPLPPVEGREEIQFEFKVPNEDLIQAKQSAFETALEMLAKNSLPPNAGQKRAVDSLLKVVRSNLDARKTDDRGMVCSPNVHFPIRVSPSSLKRAFDIVESLLVRMVSFGATLGEFKATDYRQLKFSFEGAAFSLQIEETSVRVEVPPEKRPKHYGGYTRPADAWRLEATGKLTLKVSGPGYGGRTFRDGRHKIEERLDDVVGLVFESSAEEKEKARIRDERFERAVAYLVEKDKVRQELEFQERRKRQLSVESRLWRKAQSLRDYAFAVEKAGFDASSASFASEDTWVEWLAWARTYIDSLDPITQGKAGVTPQYPAPKDFTSIPSRYLDFDDPAVADRDYNARGW